MSSFMSLLVVLILQFLASASLTAPLNNVEDRRIETFVKLIRYNLKTNGWFNILTLGPLPDTFFTQITQDTKLTFSVLAIGENYSYMEMQNPVYYKSSIIVISCLNFVEFEDALLKALEFPYWDPLSNIILYYRSNDRDLLPKIFFIFWYYRACNVVIAQYDDTKEIMNLSYFSPYISDSYTLTNQYGCWKVTKLSWPLNGFQQSFDCEEGCHSVTLNSIRRAMHLGTCIGFKTLQLRYGDSKTIQTLVLFEDKGKDLHGYVFRSHASSVLPFLTIEEQMNGTYTIAGRDGKLWTTAAEKMNFKIHVNSSEADIKREFDYASMVNQIYMFSIRELDIVLFPVYLYDLVIVEVDMNFPFTDSGVCIISHRADYETILFDSNLLLKNFATVIKFSFCFIGTWFLFFVYNYWDRGAFSVDQIGRDFLNTVRNVLSISLYNPPRRQSFRLYLTVSIWCFFVINFATQAAIVSFFSAYKRGRDVETFKDVIEKKIKILALASPDMILPDTEERFIKINSIIEPIPTLFGCVNRLANESNLFCLLDCSVARYLARNRLKRGQRYLHIAKERIHSRYLNTLMQKNSPLYDNMNKFILRCIEAGLISKWEQYRYNDLKEDAHVKALNLEDFVGVYKCYGLFLGLCSAVFLIEITVAFVRRIRK